MKDISVVLVGIGGYGGIIAKEVFEHTDTYGIEAAGIVNCNYENAPLRPETEKRQIPHYYCDIIRGIKKPVCTPKTMRPHLLFVNTVTEFSLVLRILQS